MRQLRYGVSRDNIMRSKTVVVPMLFVGASLTVLSPVIALPLNVLGLIFTRGRTRKLFVFFVALSLAFLAYIWIPDSHMDLYRHHQQVEYLARFDFGDMGILAKSNLAPAEYLFKYIFAKISDRNLLQFVVILCGYGELLWMICDYCELKKVRIGDFILLLLFVICAVRFINFASGLWFNFAVINVAVGSYMMFFKKTKLLHYLFFVFGACLHISTILAIALIMLLSNIRIFRKMNIITITVLFGSFLSFGAIVNVISVILGSNSAVARLIGGLYDSYFVNGDRFDYLHTGWNLALPFANVMICLIASSIVYKRSKNNRYANIIIYLSVCILAMIINAGVFMRYGFLIVMMSLPILEEALKLLSGKRSKVILVVAMYIMIAMQLSRIILQMRSSGLFVQIDKHLFDGIFYIIGVNNNGFGGLLS